MLTSRVVSFGNPVSFCEELIVHHFLLTGGAGFSEAHELSVRWVVNVYRFCAVFVGDDGDVS